jgi:hypothetical protein
MRLRGIALLILLAAALIPSPLARAAPTTYFVNFTGGPTLPALGVFSYDAASGFSNFFVSWNGTLFDLTGAANAPGVGGGCPGATSSPATGFALMNHSLCDGVFSRWIGSQFGGLSSFSFYNETLALPAHTGAFIDASVPGAFDPFPANSSGDWTLTNLTGVTGPAVSEPPTISVLLAGLFVLAGWRIRCALPGSSVQLGSRPHFSHDASASFGSGFQSAMMRAHSRAWAVLPIPGNRRRSSTAAESSPRCS